MEKVFRRLAFGCVWYVVFWLGLSIVGGGLAGAAAGNQQAISNPSIQQRFDRGYQVGFTAGQEFQQRFGRTVKIAAVVLATVGTLAGILPGTKREQA